MIKINSGGSKPHECFNFGENQLTSSKPANTYIYIYIKMLNGKY